MMKLDLVKAIEGEVGATNKDTGTFLNAFIDAVCENLKKGLDVSITGFSAFSIAERSAHKARNFQTGEMEDVAASKTVKFKAGKTLKKAMM